MQSISINPTVVNYDSIIHTVAFKLKHKAGSSKEQAFLTRARALANIKGVQDFEVHKLINDESPYGYELTMCFKNYEIYDAYNAHPDHVDFVQNVWMHEVAEFLEKDTVMIWQSENAKSAKADVQHSMAFKLKWDNGTKEEQAFLEQGAAKLQSLPGVKALYLAKQISTANPYDYEVIVCIKDIKAYQALLNNTDYKAYRQNVWHDQVQDALQKDTVLLD